MLLRWQTAKYEKRIEKMQTQGICPQCHGTGNNHLVLDEPLLSINVNLYNCSGCNGSGLFSSWFENN